LGHPPYVTPQAGLPAPVIGDRGGGAAGNTKGSGGGGGAKL